MNSTNRILALSSSRVGKGPYLGDALPMIRSFLGEAPLKVAFIPFAFVQPDREPLAQMVRQAFDGLPYEINTVQPSTAATQLADADVLMVSGGNTFKLLHDLYATGLLALIRQKVLGGTPYIGWSAGSNITGATICTTNDMPIIQPPSFEALGFFPFQINPHYYNVVVEGFNGETRDQRLAEYVMLNRSRPVVCLPEGTALRLDEGRLSLEGQVSGYKLTAGPDGGMLKTEIAAGGDLTDLLTV